MRSLGKSFIKLKHIKIFNAVQKSNNKIVSSRLLICLVTYSGCPHSDTPGLFFLFILLLNFCQLYEQGRVKIFSMFWFLETNIREQKKYEKRLQPSLDNTVNDMRYEIEFENIQNV